LSKTEDYLDSLLSAVSDGSAGRVVRKDSKDSKTSQKESRYSRRKSAVSDKRFIDEFENELMLDDSEDTDEFLRAFEMELDEDMNEDLFGAVSADVNKTISESEDNVEVPVSNETDIVPDTEPSSVEMDTDSLLSEAMSILESAPEDTQDVQEAPLEEAVEVSSEGEMPENDVTENDLPEGGEDENALEMPEDILAELEGLSVDAAVEKAGEEPLLLDENEDLMNILDGGVSEDEEISDIGDLLKALGNDEIVTSDGDDVANSGEDAEPSILDELEALSAELGSDEESHSSGGIDDFGDDVVEVQAEADAEDDSDKKSKKKKDKKPKEKKEKAKKEKSEGGFFAKLSRILFGDDEDEADEDAIVATEGLESLTDENLAIIADLEADSKAAEGKKDKKGKKEKKAKEKKEKPKKEKAKKEKKPKAPKQPKPKKKVNPDDLDLTPPLPKAPVILIFIMVISFVVLAFLATNLLDQSNMNSNAKHDAKNKDYVQAYSNYTGKNLSEKEETQKAKYEVLAIVQAEYDDYVNLMHVNQYEMAIDALICAVGRYSVNYDIAISNDVAIEYGELHDKILSELDKLGIAEADAIAIYEIRDREEYSKTVHELTKSLGYEVD